MNERARQTERGKKTLERVVKEFEKQGFSVETLPFTHFTPDLVAIKEKTVFGCEVKGMTITWNRNTDPSGERINRLKLPADQWTELTKYCANHFCDPLVVVEVKTRGRKIPFLYFSLTYEAMCQIVGAYSTWIAPSVWEIIHYGAKLNDILTKTG